MSWKLDDLTGKQFVVISCLLIAVFLLSKAFLPPEWTKPMDMDWMWMGSGGNMGGRNGGWGYVKVPSPTNLLSQCYHACVERKDLGLEKTELLEVCEGVCRKRYMPEEDYQKWLYNELLKEKMNPTLME